MRRLFVANSASARLINGQSSSATEELKADLIAEAGDFLGAYQPEQLGGVFKSVYDNPHEKIAYGAFANLGFRARQLRDFAVGTASTAPDYLATGLALNQNAFDFWNRAVEDAVGYGTQKTGTADSVSYKDVAERKPQTITTEEWKTNKQKFIDHGLVDESIGIGNAIKAFDRAKGKFDKATNKNRDKLKQQYIEAGGRLITTAINTKPVNILGKPFKPAEDYWKELVSLVDSRKPT